MKEEKEKGTFHYHGKPTELVMKWISEMIKEGVTVYLTNGEIPPGGDDDEDPPS
jgi:hypothetical protein